MDIMYTLLQMGFPASLPLGHLLQSQSPDCNSHSAKLSSYAHKLFPGDGKREQIVGS
jgi:hypothetical protein